MSSSKSIINYKSNQRVRLILFYFLANNCQIYFFKINKETYQEQSYKFLYIEIACVISLHRFFIEKFQEQFN